MENLFANEVVLLRFKFSLGKRILILSFVKAVRKVACAGFLVMINARILKKSFSINFD